MNSPYIAEVWEIERELGRGAMGVVHAARHRDTDQRVALKVMSEELSEHSSHAERFRREAALLRQLSHEGIVRIVDTGRDARTGQLWLAMELLEGETLRDRMDQGDADALALLGFVRAILDPLAAAHALAIIHRDLKPDNVFLVRQRDGSERVKILDFGIARPIAERSATQTGMTVGTPWYMSPEQALRPSTVAEKTDIWSIGVMLYEALLGEPPFDGETPHAVLLTAASQPHASVRERRPEVPEALSALVDRCLAKGPAERPSATELGLALDELLARPSTQAALRFRVSHHPRSLVGSAERTAEPQPGTAAVPLVRRAAEPSARASDMPEVPAPRAITEARTPSARGPAVIVAAIAAAVVLGVVVWAMRGGTGTGTGAGTGTEVAETEAETETESEAVAESETEAETETESETVAATESETASPVLVAPTATPPARTASAPRRGAREAVEATPEPAAVAPAVEPSPPTQAPVVTQSAVTQPVATADPTIDAPVPAPPPRASVATPASPAASPAPQTPVRPAARPTPAPRPPVAPPVSF